MKYFITALLLMTMYFAKAQSVNIPDTNFRNALIVAGVDVNADGAIQNTEAEAIIDLAVISAGAGIADYTGIKAFTNMVTCTITGINAAASLDVSNMTSLEKLDATNMGISFLDVANCTNLKELKAGRNQFPAIDISSCANLEYAGIYGNSSLQNLHIGNLSKLTFLYIMSNPNLHTNLDLTGCDSLQYFVMNQTNRIDTLNISGLTKFRGVGAFTIQNLIARNCTGLNNLNYQMTVPASITNSADFTGCINLEYIQLTNLNVPSLDLSTCVKLKNIAVEQGGEKFESMNIKNGSVTNVDYRMMLTRPLNVCADDFEVDTLRQLFPPNSNPLVPSMNINSFCTFIPGGNINSIKGKFVLDLNNNGCDSADGGMANTPVKMTDAIGNSTYIYAAPTGNYAHYPYSGVFTLTPYFPYPYFMVTPATASVTFDTANSLTATRDFCIQPNGMHNDLEISFLPSWPPAKPGVYAGYNVVYKNKGNTTLSGTVQLNFDNSKIGFFSASVPVSTQGTGQVTWNYNNLRPFESRYMYVRMYIQPPPANNIGDTIVYLAAINPSASDETAFDNSFILPQRVRSSWDPNEKECLEGSQLDISEIGDYLHYQIHFQNEGTDTAFNVVVADTLSDKLDWNTFEFIGSSHACNPQLKNNKAEFVFENINLPYKAIDEPGSNGWVAFKIKPKPSVVIGDSLNNSAAIYFDFNLPVITNTATTIVSTSSSPVPVKLKYFSVNKKENTNQLNWKASCTYGNAGFVIERSSNGINFKPIGNINATALRCQLPFNFTDNNSVAGKNYYRLKIADADGKSFYSKTLVVGNNKAGVEITAVANNIVYLNSNKQQVITMKVIAADGREVFNQKQTVGSGNNNIGLQMENTAKGIYTLIVYSNEGKLISAKFIK